MFQYYFTYMDDLPAGLGYPMFGKVHIAWLICIAAGIAVCTVCFLHLKERGQNRFLLALAVILLAMEAYREIVLVATGAWRFGLLPLHMCGLAIFLEAFYVFFPNPFFGEITCVLCLPGAASALIFPDWLAYPTINYMNLHSFILHGILCLLPIMLLVSRRYEPRIKRYWMTVVFLAGAVPIIHWINVAKGMNFMFIELPSTGSPFAGVYQAYGYAPYLIFYVGVVFGVVLLMYAGIYVVRAIWKHSRRGRKAQKTEPDGP